MCYKFLSIAILLVVPLYTMEPLPQENSSLHNKTYTYLQEMYFALQTRQHYIPWSGIKTCDYNAQKNLLAYARETNLNEPQRVHVYDLPSMNNETSFCKTIQKSTESQESIQSLQFSRSGNFLFVIVKIDSTQTNDTPLCVIHCINCDTKNMITKKNILTPFSYNADETYCSAIYRDQDSSQKYAAVWKIASIHDPNPLYKSSHGDYQNSVLNSDGSQLYLITANQVDIINLETKQTIRTFSLPFLRNPDSSAYLFNDTLLFIIRDYIVHYYNLTTHNTGSTPPLKTKSFYSNAAIIALSYDCTIQFWHTQQKPAYLHEKSPVTALTCNDSGTLLATLTKDKMLSIWDTTKQQCIYTTKQDQPIIAFFFNNDSSILYGITQDYIGCLQLAKPEIPQKLTQAQHILIEKIYNRYTQQQDIFLSNIQENEAYIALPDSLKNLLNPYTSLYTPEECESFCELMSNISCC